jgi:hypothetical protein
MDGWAGGWTDYWLAVKGEMEGCCLLSLWLSFSVV